MRAAVALVLVLAGCVGTPDAPTARCDDPFTCDDVDALCAREDVACSDEIPDPWVGNESLLPVVRFVSPDGVEVVNATAFAPTDVDVANRTHRLPATTRLVVLDERWDGTGRAFAVDGTFAGVRFPGDPTLDRSIVLAGPGWARLTMFGSTCGADVTMRDGTVERHRAYAGSVVDLDGPERVLEWTWVGEGCGGIHRFEGVGLWPR